MLKCISCLAILVAQAAAAGPAYLRSTSTAVVLGNDFLERTISIADGDVGTRQLLNKLTGRAYSLRGAEFELKINYERVGYSFGNENPRVVTAAAARVASKSLDDVAGGGKRLTLHLAPLRGTAIDLIYEIKPDDFYTRQWVKIGKPQQGTFFIDWLAVSKNEWGVPRFSLGGFGQPLFAEDLFLGLEFPSGMNTAEGADVSLGSNVGINIPADGYSSEPAVIGVAPAGLVHPQFMEYVNRIRVAPVRPFLLYNTWYDYPRLKMNHDNMLERVPTFQKLLLSKYGLHMDSFVLDDGWDDMHKLWVIDQERFPKGFHDLTDALKTINTNLGIWFGPIGGYDQSQVRIATGKSEGMEITSNGRYLCIAGKNYSKLLTDTMLKYEKEYGLNYFKLDGIAFGCNEPDHGHPNGVYSDEATTRTFIGMLQKLRAENPKVFLNITTSIWLSPWWLQYADTVWMGGADSGYLPSVPTMAQRQSAVSYRDSVLYDDFVTHRAQFPISSLMTHGIIKGQANMLGGEKELIEDFRDEVVHYYSVGNMMYEWYISPNILSPEELDTLGNTTKWAMANAHPLLDNSTLVLGDPAQREPYGYVHSTPQKSIVTLRNPFVQPRTVKLKIDEANGFRKFEGGQVMEVQYPYRKIEGASVKFGDTVTYDIGSYEQVVFELHPGDNVRIDGRFSVDNGAVHTYAPSGTPDISFAPATLRRDANDAHVTAAIQVPAGFREARIAVLVEPETENRAVKADALDTGKALALTSENGGRGIWHWFWANLPPGSHSVDLTVHGAGRGRVSAWLLTRRELASKEIRVTPAPAPSLLPTQSNIERGTYMLLQETLR